MACVDEICIYFPRKQNNKSLCLFLTSNKSIDCINNFLRYRLYFYLKLTFNNNSSFSTILSYHICRITREYKGLIISAENKNFTFVFFSFVWSGHICCSFLHTYKNHEIGNNNGSLWACFVGQCYKRQSISLKGGPWALIIINIKHIHTCFVILYICLCI